MAKGRPIGTIYAELDLDASKFTKAQKTILKEAGVVTTGVEKNYKTLGIKSATMFDAMRKQAENAYQGIAHSSRATADDIKRAEEAKVRRIKQLNEEQYGHQKTLLEHLQSHWKAYSLAAIGAVTAAGYAIQKVAKITVTAAMEQEKAERALSAALRANNEYTETQIAQYKKFASSVQAVTKYGDEEILNLMALQRNLGVTSDRLEDAAKMAIGLATATNRDVQSMSQYVAMAQQGEFTMLRRYIPALRSTEDKTEQLRIVTEFAAKGFKVAQEEAETFSGGLKQLSNLWGDVKERVGDAIIKNQAILDLMERGKKTLIEWADQVERWVSANGELIAQKTEEAIKRIADALVNVGNALATIAKYAGLRSISATFVEGAKLAEQELIDWNKFVEASFTERQRMVDEAKESMKTMGKVYRGVIEQIKEDSEDAQQPIKNITKTTVDLADEIKRIKEEHAEFFAGPFDWEADIPQIYSATTALESMDAAIKRIKGEHADFFAEPFDWEEPLYDSTIAYTEAQEEIRKETEKTAEENQKIWDNHLESVQSGFSSTFYDIFTNMGDGFSGIFDKI
ncbi:MAG TPA: hypothetical protein PLK94_03610, partial [Alphaproteobacteria bacterium]|nr:hypothetical protein [Alphaproteobacteria bacterium]